LDHEIAKFLSVTFQQIDLAILRFRRGRGRLEVRDDHVMPALKLRHDEAADISGAACDQYPQPIVLSRAKGRV